MKNTKIKPISIDFLDREPDIYKIKLNSDKNKVKRNQLICRWIPTGEDYPKMKAIWVSAAPD